MRPESLEREYELRNAFDAAHSSAQAEILFAAYGQRETTGLFPYPAIDMEVAPGRWRIADLAPFDGRPASPYPLSPPMAVVEVVSLGDSQSGLMARMRGHEQWGVRHGWLVDPYRETLHRYRSGGLEAVEALEIPERGFATSGAQVFS